MIVIFLFCFGTCLFQLGESTANMDPVVTITETMPPTNDKVRVRGFIAKDVTLNCYVENLPKDKQVQWQRTAIGEDGRISNNHISTDMDVQDNNKWSIEKPTLFSWRLRIKALQIADEGNYTCYIILSLDNKAETSIFVLATDPPTIQEAKMSSDVTVKEGEYYELMCNATGRPTPTLVWRRQGNAILPEGGVVKLGGRLVIKTAKFSDRGVYICDCLNEVGQVSREILFGVQFSPKLTSNGDVTQAVGYRRTLLCYVDANPRPRTDQTWNELYWTRNSLSVKWSDRIFYRILEGAHSRLIFELTFKRVEEDDYGEYFCNARNSMGTGSATVLLSKSTEPVPDKGGIISGTPPLPSAALKATSIVLGLVFSLILSK